MIQGYWLGLPAWAYPGWRDGLLADRSRAALDQYSDVFNAVEGNTTFYQLPSVANVGRWKDQVEGKRFEFSFKLPRTVTHELGDWARCEELSTEFFDRLSPLDAHLGPFLVQFPARVGPRQLGDVERLLGSLPAQYGYRVEVRHRAFFATPHRERLLKSLVDADAGQVCLDTRPIYCGDQSHPEVTAEWHVKPDLPVRPVNADDRFFLRLVCHPDEVSNGSYFDEWADRVGGWIASGHSPRIMIHCPNNDHCVVLARWFHETLAERVSGMPMSRDSQEQGRGPSPLRRLAIESPQSGLEDMGVGSWPRPDIGAPADSPTQQLALI